MKVAVTGARDFIGRHVLAELAKRPVDVVAITRQPSIEISTSPQARIIQLDLRDEYADSLNMIGNPDVYSGPHK